MLFEPSGELRCDYGAYCHVLSLTEREDLYKSLLTDEEVRREKDAQFLGLDASAVEIPAAVRDAALIGSGASACVSGAASSTAATPRGARGASGKRQGSGGGKKRNAATDSPKSGAQAAPLTLSFISMRHPKFCLNQRDMRPLALAIPHCLSLVSVEFVGCGLSLESFLLLVEAVYKSRRVATLTLDFNCAVRPGFYADPTVPAPEPEPPRSWTPEGSLSVTASCERLTAFEESPALMVLAPSAYRGLSGAQSASEAQAREERERKGRGDSKKQKQMQLQQQQLDQVALIDREFPVFVPRGWPAVLLTGVKHVSLRGNGITDAVVGEMCSLLLRHPRSELVSLNLWGNAIGDAGAAALARLLRRNRTLQALDLGRNAIGDAGLRAIVECFRVQEVAPDDVPAYRQRHLARRDAGAKERQLAATAPPAYPSYQELYTAWHQSKFPAVEEKRDAKKVAQTKAKRVAEPTFSRPSTPFDCDCVRTETAVRVPGNTVLRCVNLGDNRAITLAGAEEARRVLALQEPTTDEEMAALHNSAEELPEPHCAGIQLRALVVMHSGDPALREAQRAISEVLRARLLLLPQPPVEEEEPIEESKRKTPRKR